MSMAVSRCPESDALAAWAEGSASVDREGISRHVDCCDECNAAVAAVRSVTGGEFGSMEVGRPLADRYLLETVLDQGGRGVICVARDLVLGRRVAIKLARRDDEHGALLREATTQAAVQDPNVLSVLDAGYDGDHTFVVVEYVDGVDAAVACLAPNFTVEAARRIVGDAARGLAALHRAQLVHGDVTPRNLMVGHDGRTRIIDFGLATGRRGRGGGTPGFMAPEQGRTGPTPATDQYGLGETLAVLLRHATNCSPALQRVVRRACDPDPQRRYRSVEAMAHALRRPRWRNAIPAVVLAALAALVAPEGPRDLDAYFMGRLEDAVETALVETRPDAARMHAAHAATLAARTQRPEFELRAALLAVRAAPSDASDQIQHELALTAARLAQEISNQALRTEALLALSTSPKSTIESSKVLVALADASARSLPADDPRHDYLDIAHMIFDMEDPAAPEPELQGDTAPIAAMVRLYRGFGEPGWTVRDVGCETVERTYPRGLCYGIQAQAYVSSTEALLDATGSAPARRFADLSLDVLGRVDGLDHCDLQLGLLVRGTTRLEAEPEAAEADLKRALEVCGDTIEPGQLLMLRVQWGRALLRIGEVHTAAQMLDRASGLGIEDDDARAFLDVLGRELDAAAG